MTYDLTIIGGGPAAVAAGVYAGRKKLKTLVIAKEFGGQSVVSENIYNWIGTKEIPGNKLAKDLKDHLYSYKGENFDIKEGILVQKIEKQGDDNFKVITNNGEEHQSRTVLVTTGSQRRKLQIKGADQFEHKGITYCASCDGPLFSGQDVIVIGGGNAGFETSAQLLAYTNSVTLLEYNPEFKADKITVEKVLADKKMTALKNVEITEIFGDKFVTGLKIKDRETGEEETLETGGIFVEIGAVPAVDFVKDLVKTNDFGQVIVDPKTQKSSEPGIWAAGDCTDGLYHQNNIAVGDAVKALEDIYISLKTK